MKKIPKYIYLILFLTLILFGCTYYQIREVRTEFGDYAKTEIEKPESIEEMIIRKSKEANLNPSTSLKIARCESSMNPLAQSKSSSAKGLYQFISRTWNAYCKGNPLKAEDNINCFIKLYPKHKNWWVCRG